MGAKEARATTKEDRALTRSDGKSCVSEESEKPTAAAEVEKPASRGEVYRRAIEAELSHGAFRLWHLYYNRSDEKSQCNWGFRKISKTIRCKKDSVSRWNKELEAAQWLSIFTEGKTGIAGGNRNYYVVLDGQGNPIKSVPFIGTHRPPKRGRINKPPKRGRCVPQTADAASPFQGTEVTLTKDKGESTPKSSSSGASLGNGDSASHSPTCSAEKGQPKTIDEIRAEKTKW
jgi:hypothetical protein